jgi:hypothetical protein
MTREFETLPRANQNSYVPPEAEDASPQFLRDVTPSMVSRVMTNHFADIDTNKNGLLSLKELESYVPSPQDQFVKEYTKYHFEELTKVHNGSIFGDHEISRFDLTQYQIQQDPNLPLVQERFQRYSELLNDNFKIIDADQDEKLTVQELDAALTSTQLDVGAKQMVRFYRDNYDAMTSTFKPAFIDGPMEFEKNTLSWNRDLFDFKNSFSNSAGLEFAGMGAVMGGVIGGLLTGLRLTKMLNITPTWQIVAAGAAVGGLAFGTYMYITGREASKTIPVSRERMWHSLSAELAQESVMGTAPQLVTELQPSQQPVPAESTTESGDSEEPQAAPIGYLPTNPDQVLQAPQYW